MKTIRRIGTSLDVPQEIEFYDPRRDTLVRIENQSTGVTIRATRHRLHGGAEESLIRYLANEGFIAERYRWASARSDRGTPGIQWITDGSWVRFRHRRIRLATRLWAYLTWERLLLVALFPLAVAATIWFKRH